jgi:DNA-binding transcriptional MocR family regulator
MTLIRYAGGMDDQWTPSLESQSGTLHQRLIQALRDDIASGALEPEARMPSHRDLAQRLGIGIGTVTRAYAEAVRLGLLVGTVGRGTFVAPNAVPRRDEQPAIFRADAGGVIDLTLNIPTLDVVASCMGDVLDRIRQRPDISDYVTFTAHAGVDWHRQALAEWLRKVSHFRDADWRRLIVTTGAQHAMSLAMDVVLRRGDTLLVEAVTFSGTLAAAAQHGLQPVGVAMDREGIRPDALEEAAVRHQARAVYIQPTLQNPTTRTMSMARRREIVEVARRHDLTLIEDDVKSALAFAFDTAHRDLVPLAVLAPERTIYLTSVSKTLSPGLRVGMLVAPDEERFDRLCVAMRANCYTPGTMGSLIVAQWIRDGVAQDVLRAIAQEAGTRQALAKRLLGTAVEDPSFPTTLHIWLPMSELQAERFASRALRRGVAVTPPSSFIVDGELVSGVRLCLNSVPRADLERALVILRSVLADEIVPGRLSVV